MSTYKKACQEGWVSAPTNDIQKAIWDKVHAAPKNPMKIEFDSKKGDNQLGVAEFGKAGAMYSSLSANDSLPPLRFPA